MPTTVFSSSNTPITIPATNSIVDSIVSSSENGGVLTNILCTVNITAPDEGAGVDPTLLEVHLTRGSTDITLHLFGSDSLAGITYDSGRAPAVGNMNSFDGLDLTGTWQLTIANIGMTDGVLNSWSVTLTYNLRPDFGKVPAAQTRTVPGNIKYGKGVPQRKQTRSTFNSNGPVSAQSLLDHTVVVPFDSTINEIRLSARNCGNTNVTKLSLYKFSNGVLSTLISQEIKLPNDGLFHAVKFANRDEFAKNVLQGDVIFFGVDVAATGLQDLSVEVVFNALR